MASDDMPSGTAPQRQVPAGVTISATIIFLLSGTAILFGVIMCLGIFSAVPRAGGVGIGMFYYFIYTGLGIATGMGLLRLKAWARVSVIVMSSFVLFVVSMIALAFSIAGPLITTPRGGPPWPPMTLLLPAVALSLLSVWFLVYFNLKQVRTLFDEYPTTGHYSRTDGSAQTLFLRPPPPLSIVLIGSMYLMTVMALIPAIWKGFPAVVLGKVVQGPLAQTAYFLFMIAALYTGIGLLKVQPAARILAIVLSILHVVNNLLFVLLPGLEDRLMELFARFGVPFPPEINMAALLTLIRVALVPGVAFSVVILWFLVTRKNAFLPPGGQPRPAFNAS